MRTTLAINCRTAILIKDRENTLADCDSVVLNCANAFFSDEVYAQLVPKLTLNCAHSQITKTPQNPVVISQRFTLSENSPYDGAYLICENDLTIGPNASRALAALAGAYVAGTLYYPSDISQSALGNVQASQTVAYPSGAHIVYGDLWLTQENILPLQGDVFVTDTLYSEQGDALALALQKGMHFFGQCLYIYQGLSDTYFTAFTVDEVHLINDGLRIATRTAPLADLYAAHGDKVFLCSNIEILPRDIAHLGLFSALHVHGRARVPLEHLSQIKQIVTADTYQVYEGDPMQINGVQILTQAALAAAVAAGQRLSITANGVLIIEDNVTLQDISAICSLDLNGVLCAPSALHPFLASISGKQNGLTLGSIAETRAWIEQFPEQAIARFGNMMPAPLLSVLGLESDQNSGASAINCATYLLV